MKQRILITMGVCILVASLGIGLIFAYQRKNEIKPVSDNVTNSTSQSSTSSDGISVSNASPENGINQAGSSEDDLSNTSSTTSNDSSSEIAEMTNPSTFSKYDTPTYEDASQAFYANLQTGTGTELSKAGQKAIISYKGWLTNGTLFDETQVNAKGQSEAYEFTFEASPEQVIPGFDEGLSGMKVGGTRLLIVPPTAGYGSTTHDSIPANSVLIFEVTLDEIQ